MFNSGEADNPAKQFQHERDIILEAIQQAKDDNGAAYAYRYCGEDDQTAVLLQTLNVYAMVRSGGNPAELQRVDYFLPAITVTAAEQKSLDEQGFVRVGFIDNHYNDVFGLCDGVIDETTDQYPESLTTACYNRLKSISPLDAEIAAANWSRSSVSMTQAKQEIVKRLYDYKRGLELFYLDQTTVNQQPGWN